MSYILEALRKSEQQRQLAEVPSLYTAQLASSQESPAAFGRYTVIAMILICTGILIAGWRYWQAAEATSVSPLMPRPANNSTPSETQPFVPEPALDRSRKFEPLPMVKDATPFTTTAREPREKKRAHSPAVPGRRTTLPASPPTTETTVPANKTPSPPAKPAAAPRIPDEMSERAEASGSNGSTEFPQNRKVIALDDLPPAIRQELPPMAISGFTYSEEPRQRIVGINDRLLQEGQYLAPGLKLEQIGQDGLVFSYREYRFRKSLP